MGCKRRVKGATDLATRHISDRTSRITQGGYATLGVMWKDNGVLIEDSKLFFITDGEIVIKTKEGETVCREGDMVLIPAGRKHDYFLSDVGVATKYWFHFSVQNEMESAFDRYNIPLKIQISPDRKEYVKRLFEKVVSREKTSEQAYIGKLGALLELVAFYIEASGAEEKEREKK